MTRPLLSLVMIVKDEARSIRAVLEAARPHVDRYTILDTGSTDGTQDIVREVLKDLPGALCEEPFVDFAASRNRSLDLDAQADNPAEFQIVLSGDEYLRGGPALRAALEEQRSSAVGCYCVRLTLDDTALYSPRIFRTGSPWRYEGEIHEYPANRVEEKAPVETIAGPVIEHIVSDLERRLSNIWESHIPILLRKLEENPRDERALIFLAQSYETLLPGFGPEERVTYAMEAMSLYLRRLAIPTGMSAERNYCRMHYIDTARLTSVYTDAELLTRAETLFEDDPQRPETALLVAELSIRVKPLVEVYERARRAAEVAEKAQVIENSSPVSTACGWKSHYLAAVAARQLAGKYPQRDVGGGVTYEKLLRDHVAAGLAAGGVWALFRAVAEEVPRADATPVQTSSNAFSAPSVA